MSKNQLLDESLVEVKLGSYGVSQSSALKDPSLLPNVRNYKRQVASRMLPLGREDISRKVPDAQYHVSRKIDGEFSVLAFKDGDLLIVNPGGTVRVGLPWQAEAKDLLAAAGLKDVLFVGELYGETTEDRRPRVHDIVSVARQPKSEDDLQRIKFAVFDIISIDSEPLENTYDDRWAQIESVFAKGKMIHPVESVSVKGHHEVDKLFQQWVVDEKSEGLVVRSETAGNFKIKPRHNLDAVVIGFTESTDDRQGMLHDLLLGVVRSDGSAQILCRVGGGFTDENRREMLSDLQDMVVDSEYAEVNSDHVAYQMVKPKWVVEISCLDLISQNTRGGPVNRMVLNWNSKDERYEVVRRLPLVSVISPQFIRVRDDKQFNETDVRIAQVNDLVPVPMANVSARELKMAESELLEREVYTKQLRGEMLVRKFLLWKTNKESESAEYPAFVAAYTDFSPTRKTPLTRDVRISNSETQIRGLFETFKEENIKKGWELHCSRTASHEAVVGEAASASASVPKTPATPKETKLKAPESNSNISEPKNSKATKKKVAKKKAGKKKAADKNKATDYIDNSESETAATNPDASKPTAKKSDVKKKATKKKSAKKKAAKKKQ